MSVTPSSQGKPPSRSRPAGPATGKKSRQKAPKAPKTSKANGADEANRAGEAGQPKAPLSATSCLPYVINVITNYVNETMHEDLRRVGMTVPRWTVLSALRDEDGMAIGDLASRCMIRQSSLTRVVDQLQRDGHVRRRHARGDQRVVQVFITKAGNELYESVVPDAVERASSGVRTLLSTEIDALSEVLERAASALKGTTPARTGKKDAARGTTAKRRRKSVDRPVA